MFCGFLFWRLPEIQWCVLRSPCNQDERILALILGLTELYTPKFQAQGCEVLNWDLALRV